MLNAGLIRRFMGRVSTVDFFESGKLRDNRRTLIGPAASRDIERRNGEISGNRRVAESRTINSLGSR